MNIAVTRDGMAFNTPQYVSTPGGRDTSSSSAVPSASQYWDENQYDSNDFFEQFLVLDDTGDVVSLNDADNQSSTSSHHGGNCITDASSVEQGHTPYANQACNFDMLPLAAPVASMAKPPTGAPLGHSPFRNGHPAGVVLKSEPDGLRLEGLSMRSPHRGALPSSSTTSVPTSPTTQPATTKKLGRLENIYSTIRKAPSNFFRRGSRQDHELSQPTPMSTAQLSPGKRQQHHPHQTSQHHPPPFNMNFDKFQVPMPLSPPLTSPRADMHFMNGFMDDPFVDSRAMHEQHMKPTRTPLGTPLTDTTANTTGWHIQDEPSLQPGDDASMWNFIPGESHWDNAGAVSGARAIPPTFHLAMPMQQGFDPHQHQLANSGLAIHMQHPPTPGPTLIQDPGHQLAHNMPIYNPQTAHQPYTPHGLPEHRRKPRAPSSGARHHAMTSPRKVRETSVCRSISPSPATPSRGPQSRIRRAASLQGIGTSVQPEAAVRKRRSLSRTRRRPGAANEPRTPGGRGVSYGSSFESFELEMEMDGMGLPEAGLTLSDSPRKGSGGQTGFVNFTPNDHNILMTGVAPSGSSKTKARREKEAAERQRKLNEAVVKAVQAAGGDVQKLREEGLVGP